MEEEKENPNQPKSQTKSLIQLMYESQLPEESIRDNVSGFFLAAQETTVIALCWLMSIFVSYPDVQNRARKEANKLPKKLTYDSVKELRYIDALIKEGMRMYCPVPSVISRCSKKDTTVGNVQLPAGTPVVLNLISMAHDPEIWGDPSVFRPERFYLENITKTQRDAYKPFSGSPRTCIGQNFSLFQQKLFVVALLRKYNVIKLAPNGKITTIPGGALVYCPVFDKLIIQFK